MMALLYGSILYNHGNLTKNACIMYRVNEVVVYSTQLCLLMSIQLNYRPHSGVLTGPISTCLRSCSQKIGTGTRANLFWHDDDLINSSTTSSTFNFVNCLFLSTLLEKFFLVFYSYIYRIYRKFFEFGTKIGFFLSCSFPTVPSWCVFSGS
jgi:hypothetical protein